MLTSLRLLGRNRTSSLPSSLRNTMWRTAVRHLGVTKKGPHADPLHLLQQECIARQLCDAYGNRLPGVDWRITLGVADASRPGAAPNVRTVGIERVTQAGIDFVVKRGSKVTQVLSDGQELAFLHTQGQFLPGQSAEQWRGEGKCVVLPLTEVLDEVPHFVITSMVGSNRIAAQGGANATGWPVDDKGNSSSSTTSEDPSEVEPARLRESVDNRSHLTEVFQKTRVELENGDVTIEELDASIRAFRLQPNRIECMTASPDSSVLWDRWEWRQDDVDGSSGTEETSVASPLSWQAPRNLVPH